MSHLQEGTLRMDQHTSEVFLTRKEENWQKPLPRQNFFSSDLGVGYMFKWKSPKQDLFQMPDYSKENKTKMAPMKTSVCVESGLYITSVYSRIRK